MGGLINVTIDRPIGYVNKYGTLYPINYGYVKSIFAGDGKEQDAYIVSNKVKEPIESFEGFLISIIKRHNDVEDKWVISSPGETYTEEEIYNKVAFIERHFDTTVILMG